MDFKILELSSKQNLWIYIHICRSHWQLFVHEICNTNSNKLLEINSFSFIFLFIVKSLYLYINLLLYVFTLPVIADSTTMGWCKQHLCWWLSIQWWWTDVVDISQVYQSSTRLHLDWLRYMLCWWSGITSSTYSIVFIPNFFTKIYECL